MKHIECNQLRAQFDDRLDGRLAEGLRTDFDRHVAVCPACGREWQQYAAAWQALACSVTIEPSIGFADRTLRRLDEPAESWIAQLWPRVWRWSMAGAAAVVLLACGWAVWQRAQDNRLASVYAQVHQSRLAEDFDVIGALDLLPNGKTSL